MGIEQRPYIGTWSLNNKKVVQHTPDALVYINGDLTIPSVDTHGRQFNIDIQRFITSVQVDCGVTPSGATANISMSIPIHSNEPFARDADNILTTGLEIHIYERGYFPVRGLFRGSGDHVAVYDDDGNLKTGEFPVEGAEGLTNDDFLTSTQEISSGLKFPIKASDLQTPSFLGAYSKGDSISQSDLKKWADEIKVPLDMLVVALTVQSEAGATPERGYSLEKSDIPYIIDSILNRITYNQNDGNRYGEDAWETVTSSNHEITSTGKQHEPVTVNGRKVYRQYGTDQWEPLTNEETLARRLNEVYARLNQRTVGDYTKATNYFHYGTQQQLYEDNAVRRSADEVHAEWTQNMNQLTATGLSENYFRIYQEKSVNFTDEQVMLHSQGLLNGTSRTVTTVDFAEGSNQGTYIGQGENYKPKTRYDDIMAYPYYHVFHGVVTSVSFSYSPGVRTATINCGSMLHFWSYQNMSSNASAFGTRPSNSKNRVSLLGHNFTGMHPYEIIYTLFHDTAGAAGAVSFVLDQKTNVDAVLGENSLYSMTIKYWEQRFSQRMFNLRLHGATGALFNTMQATAMAKLSASEVQSAFNNRSPRVGNQGVGQNFMGGLRALGLVADRNQASSKTEEQQTANAQALGQAQGQQPNQAQINQASFGNSGGFRNGKPMDINVFMMEAYVKDIGQIASINLFESSYETKMDIANKVCEVTGFEFYQDVDGDCVFKPPMYNLDTSGSRIYRIEDIDIISFRESEKEPDVTFMVTKGSQFANLSGTGVDGEWGVQGTFIDYPLVAKYGWRSGSFETAYFNDARQCFFASINRMAVMNAGINSGTLTIPIRPEMRPGYPVYIVSQDCYYYCTSVSHSYQIGGACQTTLQLVAKRKKFFAPADPNKSGIESIRLDGFSLPPKPLQVLGEDGYSKLSGFPNVVMTLDPNLINPMFFVSGADFESLTNPENLNNLLDILTQSAIEGNVFRREEEGVFSWKQGNQTKYFKIDTGNTSQGTGDQSNPYNLFALAGDKEENRLSEADKKYNAEIQTQRQRIGSITNAIARTKSERFRISYGDPEGTKKEIESLDQQLLSLQEQLQKEDQKYQELVANFPEKNNEKVFTGSAKGVDYLIEMLSLVRRYGKYDSDRFSKDWKNLESSSNLLDLISNKKSNMSNGQLPGSYRYYSSAHPNPEDQGRRIAYENSGSNQEVATPKGSLALLETPKLSKQFIPSVSITIPDLGYQTPEAELRLDQKVVAGIPLIGANGDDVVTPTDEIYSLKFQRVKGRVRKQKYVELTDIKKGEFTKKDFVEGILNQFAKGSAGSGEFQEIIEQMVSEGSSFLDYDGFVDKNLSISEFFDLFVVSPFRDYMGTVSGFSSSKWASFSIEGMDQLAKWYLGSDNPNHYFALKKIDTAYVFLGDRILTTQDKTRLGTNPIQSVYLYGHNGALLETLDPVVSFANTTVMALLQRVTTAFEFDGLETDVIFYEKTEDLREESKLVQETNRFESLSYPSKWFVTENNALDQLFVIYGSKKVGLKNNITVDFDTILPEIELDGDSYRQIGLAVYGASKKFTDMFEKGITKSTNEFDNRKASFQRIQNFIAELMGEIFYTYWIDLTKKYSKNAKSLRSTVKFIEKCFGVNKDVFKTRSANIWVWRDITTEVPVFPISDSRGYEVFGHYPYGRGLDIYANNPLDTLLQTDPFVAIDRETVENYVLALQGNKVTITDEFGNKQTLSNTDAVSESNRQLEIALTNEFSPQELLDYGLATLNANNALDISLQNWLADKQKDGVQKLTVENRAFSIADLGFLSDLDSLPSDLRTAQSDVLLPAYSTDFAEIIMSTSSGSSAQLLDQLLEPTASGEEKSRDMIHTIITQESKSSNWATSQSALRGTVLENQTSADILRSTVQGLGKIATNTLDRVEDLNQEVDARKTLRQTPRKNIDDVEDE